MKRAEPGGAILIRSWAAKLFLLLLMPVVAALATNLPQATPEQVENFKNKASLHRLRLGAGTLELLNNEEFLKAFPEYKRLAERKEDALHVTLNHDYNKVHIRSDHPIVQTFASAYGIDYRSLSPDDPRIKEITTNRDALNRLDQKAWEKSVTRQFRNKEDQKLLTELVETLDFHDTAQARKAEFGDCKDGKNCRKLDGASKWLQDKGSEMGLKDAQKKRMISLANFMEQKIDYQAIIRKYPDSTIKEKSFGLLAKELRQQSRMPAERLPEPVPTIKGSSEISRASSVRRVAGTAARAAGGALALVPATAVAADYVADPLSVKSSDLVESMMSLNETASCASPGCHRFLSKCKQEKLSESQCARKFLEDPLQDQYELRKDPDLNRILSKYSPAVLTLRCESRQKAYLQFRNRKGDLQSQTVEWDENLRITKLQIKDPELSSTPGTQVFFSQGEPASLHYADRKAGFQTLPVGEWFERKIYFWSGEPREKKQAIIEAQEADRLLKYQRSSIQNCCASLKCQDFFTDKKAFLRTGSGEKVSATQ